jgi:WD40 repeat protein
MKNENNGSSVLAEKFHHPVTTPQRFKGFPTKKLRDSVSPWLMVLVFIVLFLTACETPGIQDAGPMPSPSPASSPTSVAITLRVTTVTLPPTTPATSAPTPSAVSKNDPILQFPIHDLIHDLRWSPDGSQLAIAAGTDIHLYDAANLVEQHILTLGIWTERIAYHPSLPILGAAAKDGSIRFWDTASGTEICKFTAHRKGANSLAFQPGGVVPPERHPAGTTPAGQPGGVVPPERHPAGTTPAGQPGGNLLATTGTDIISRLWDISSVVSGSCDVKAGALLIGSSYTAPDVAFSADGQQLALVDIRNIYLRESQTRKLITVLKSDLAIFDIALSPDGRWLAAAQNDATVTLWDLTAKPRPTSTLLHLPASSPQTYIWRVDFSSDSSLLAGASSDGALLVWQLPGLQPIFRRNLSHAISGLAFKPNMPVLAVGTLDGAVYIYSPVK